jgi:quinol monooxygenase YgiN
MPVVVVAILTPKPDAFDRVREVLTRTVAAVHDEPGCQLYALHHADQKVVFIEQWADEQALTTHMTAPALMSALSEIGDMLAAPPEIIRAEAIPAGDPAKGQLVR